MSFHHLLRCAPAARCRRIPLGRVALLATAALAFSNMASGADALSFKQALALAESQAPALAARAASVQAAAEEAIRAPELPDPELVAGVDNLPVDTVDRFRLTRDFMTMRKVGVMQTFPRKEKRLLRAERADADVHKAEAELAVQRLDVRRAAAAAWVDRYLAERERDLLLELRVPTDVAVEASRAALRGDKTTGANALAASADRLQLDDRLDTAARDIEQASASLARWIGTDAATRPLGEPPDFATLGATPAALDARVEAHAALRPYEALEARAAADVALARAEKRPDWSVEVDYQQRGPAYSNMVSVEFRVGLPIFGAHRQDPAIAAKLAELDQVRAEREDAIRAHREETQKALAAWTSAQKRLKRSTDELLPLTDARVQAALAAYRGGGDIQAVIAARTAQIDARRTYLAQLGELARAWTALNFLVADKE